MINLEWKHDFSYSYGWASETFTANLRNICVTLLVEGEKRHLRLDDLSLSSKLKVTDTIGSSDSVSKTVSTTQGWERAAKTEVNATNTSRKTIVRRHNGQRVEAWLELSVRLHVKDTETLQRTRYAFCQVDVTLKSTVEQDQDFVRHGFFFS